MGKSGIGCAALFVALMLTCRESMAGPDSFGDAGQLVIDNRFQLSGGGVHYAEPALDSKSVQLNPSAAYFVTPRLSLGLGILLLYGRSHQADGRARGTTALGLAPRVG